MTLYWKCEPSNVRCKNFLLIRADKPSPLYTLFICNTVVILLNLGGKHAQHDSKYDHFKDDSCLGGLYRVKILFFITGNTMSITTNDHTSRKMPANFLVILLRYSRHKFCRLVSPILTKLLNCPLQDISVELALVPHSIRLIFDQTKSVPGNLVKIFTSSRLKVNPMLF